jgi:predicted small secreted protein
MISRALILLLLACSLFSAGCSTKPVKTTGHTAEQQRQNAQAAHDELSREVNK